MSNKMKTYILNKGHADHKHNGSLYHEGEAINTCMDLPKLFPRKFSVAPAGVTGDRWPMEVPDVHAHGEYAVVANRDGITYRIVGPDGKAVVSMEHLAREIVFKKFAEVTGQKPSKKTDDEAPKKVTKPAPKSEKDEDDDEDDDKGDDDDSTGDEDDDDEEDASKSKKSKAKGKADDADDEDDDEPKKKAKKAKKDEDDDDEDDEPKSKKSKKGKR